MCLRVLGYTHEIESKGTWPTNYMSKAQDLKMMKDIDFKSYNDGATRGNTAILIWNMLRTAMWEIGQESEGDGLVSAPAREMINVKFSDYKYFDSVIYDGYYIAEDAKEDEAKVYMQVGDYTAEYAENNFYTFVKGTPVSALIYKDEKDCKLLSIVPTDDYKYVEGTLEDLDDAGYRYVDESGETLKTLKYDYVYAAATGKNIEFLNGIVINNNVIDELNVRKDSIKINDFTAISDTRYNEYLIIDGDERITLLDLEKGDLMTGVVPTAGTGFIVVGEDDVEGELTKYVVKNNEVTVDGEKYAVSGDTTFVEDPERKTLNVQNFTEKYDDKMNGEIVTLRLDKVLGRVARIEFDGKIDSNEGSSSVHFFEVASAIKRDDDEGTFSAKLATEDDSEEYVFADNSTFDANAEWLAASKNIKTTFAMVTLNKDDEITALTVLAQNLSGEADDTFVDEIPSNEDFDSLKISSAKYDKDNSRVKSTTTDEKIKVTDSVVLVKVMWDKEAKKSTLVFAGIEDVMDLNGKFDALAIFEKDDDVVVPTAKYIVVLNDASTSTDNLLGIVTDITKNGIDHNKVDVELEDVEEPITCNDDSSAELEAGDYKVIIYKKETDSKGKTTANLVTGLKKAELDAATEHHMYVVSGDKNDAGRTFKTDIIPSIELDTEEVRDILEDCMFVVVNVEEDEGTQYKVSSARLVDYDDLFIDETDRIAVRDFEGTSIDDAKVTGPEVVFVIKGMDERN